MVNTIEYGQFLDVDIRVGTVIKAEISTSLNKPSIILLIDFGSDIGVKKSSAQITVNYKPEDILNKQVAAVVNFKPRQIGNLLSEVLVLGFPDDNKEPVLFSPDKTIKNGSKLYWVNYFGRITVTLRPPSFLDFEKEISPPWDLIISLAIVKPRPL